MDGHEHEFAPEDFVVETHEREGFRVEREGGMAVAISTVLSPELVREGLARELVHHIQNTRKAADFQIDDRIHLRVTGPAEVAEMLAVHGDWVKKETLAVSLEWRRRDAARAGGRRSDGAPPPPAPTAKTSRSTACRSPWRSRRPEDRPALAAAVALPPTARMARLRVVAEGASVTSVLA